MQMAQAETHFFRGKFHSRVMPTVIAFQGRVTLLFHIIRLGLLFHKKLEENKYYALTQEIFY